MSSESIDRRIEFLVECHAQLAVQHQQLTDYLKRAAPRVERAIILLTRMSRDTRRRTEALELDTKEYARRTDEIAQSFAQSNAEMKRRTDEIAQSLAQSNAELKRGIDEIAHNLAQGAAEMKRRNDAEEKKVAALERRVLEEAQKTDAIIKKLLN